MCGVAVGIHDDLDVTSGLRGECKRYERGRSDGAADTAPVADIVVRDIDVEAPGYGMPAMSPGAVCHRTWPVLLSSRSRSFTGNAAGTTSESNMPVVWSNARRDWFTWSLFASLSRRSRLGPATSLASQRGGADTHCTGSIQLRSLAPFSSSNAPRCSFGHRNQSFSATPTS
jgi:hypothetical protein